MLIHLTVLAFSLFVFSFVRFVFVLSLGNIPKAINSVDHIVMVVSATYLFFYFMIVS